MNDRGDLRVGYVALSKRAAGFVIFAHKNRALLQSYPAQLRFLGHQPAHPAHEYYHSLVYEHLVRCGANLVVISSISGFLGGIKK